MLNISTGKVVRVIALTREYGPDSSQLRRYISGMNEDEQVSLVAMMWIGRDTYAAVELEDAKGTAREEATAPTEHYLSGIPALAEYLEDALDKLGIDVTRAEDEL